MRPSILIPVLGLLFVGCAQRDIVTSTGHVTRDYAKPADETYTSALATCKELDFRIGTNRHDKMGGRIGARREDRSELVITIEQINPGTSRVSIYVEPENANCANDLHERIAEKLGLTPSSGGMFGGSSVSGRYRLDLQSGVNAARRAYRALGFQVTRESQNQSLAEVDGRMNDSRPLRISMELTSEDLVVIFIAGTTKTDDNRTFARDLKVEFERGLAP